VLAVLTILLASGAAALPQNAELASLYEATCLRHEPPGVAFQPVNADDIPGDVTHAYIGPQQGNYWRRPAPNAAFVAHTRGPGHWGGIEEYCTVGLAGANFESLATTFADQLGDRDASRGGRLQTQQLYGMTRIVIHGTDRVNFVVVTQRPNDWVSLMTGGNVAAAPVQR